MVYNAVIYNALGRKTSSACTGAVSQVEGALTTKLTISVCVTMVNCATEESSSGAFFIVFSDHTRHAISLACCNFTRLWLVKISTHACEIYRHITL